MLSRFEPLLDRLATYPLWQVVLELALIWVVVYGVVRFFRGTRAAGTLKGLVFLLVMVTLLVRIFGRGDGFQRVSFLYQHAVTFVAIGLLIVFQPELRRGLFRLFETPFFRRSAPGVLGTINAIVEAAAFLSKAKFGGLIVIEREASLRGLIEGGTPMDSQVSARLLQTIFFPGTALHDLAVVVSGGEIKAAGVQLPRADPEDMPDPTLGSRHRAALGISKESDALVVVVSEETGTISVAERGRLDRGFTADQLREHLLARLGVVNLDSGTSSSPRLLMRAAGLRPGGGGGGAQRASGAAPTGGTQRETGARAAKSPAAPSQGGKG